MVRLHVNVDHVGTIRQARGSSYPSPLRAAKMCEAAGVDGITVHLREDRRHIIDADVFALRPSVSTFFNLEMAMTEEMLSIAKKVKPDLVTLVPERRQERTTEGGLDVAGRKEELSRFVTDLGIPVSMFIDPDEAQVRASAECLAHAVEFHTGDYAHAFADDSAGSKTTSELLRLKSAASLTKSDTSLLVAAGHGLTQDNVTRLIAEVPEIEELNIGHALVADAIFVGLAHSVRAYQRAIAQGVAMRTQ